VQRFSHRPAARWLRRADDHDFTASGLELCDRVTTRGMGTFRGADFSALPGAPGQLARFDLSRHFPARDVPPTFHHRHRSEHGEHLDQHDYNFGSDLEFRHPITVPPYSVLSADVVTPAVAAFVNSASFQP